jgi:iron(III) transport system permease protein
MMELGPGVGLLERVRGRRSGLTGRPSFLRLLLDVSVVGIAILVGAPVVYLLIRGLGAIRTAPDLLMRSQTLSILGNTLVLMASVTAACMIIGLALAWLTLRTDLPARRALSIASMLPLAIPSYVGAYLFVAALGPRGLLQNLVGPTLGIERLPEIYGFPGAFLVLTLLCFPYSYISARAGLQRLDSRLEESARSLGEGHWGVFWRVVLPQLRPSLLSGGLLVALYTLRDFGAVSLMRYMTFTRAVYVQYKSAFDRGSAALLSFVLLGITLGVLALQTRARGAPTRAHKGSGRPPRAIRLGPWRWPAWVFCAGLIGFALILPAAVLFYWLIRGAQLGSDYGTLWGAAGNSIYASGLAAVVTVLAALPLTVSSLRLPGRWRGHLASFTSIGFALPGILIALALVFFGTRFTPWIYPHMPLLIFGYLILFLPQAVGTLRSSLAQVDPTLEEAARSLGEGAMGAFRRITLPLIRPGIIAGASLVFLTAMKELQATLILSPIGFRTLATEVWSAVSEAFFGRAAAPALLILLSSSIPMALIVLREQKHQP